jgi:dolichol-phosphate mannosyltransferase
MSNTRPRDAADPPGLLSIIVLSYQSEASLRPIVDALARTMESERIPYEILIVDDGSTDRSPAVAAELATEDDRIRCFRLSRNFGSHYSQFAGLSRARGACAVSVPDDLQFPPEKIVEMYRLWERGHKIVVASRRSRRDGLINDTISNLYYRIMNAMSDVSFPPGGSDRFLADRELIDILNINIHPINTTPLLEALRLGFAPGFLSYDRPSGPRKSRWTLRKKLRLAADTFFGSSSFPLRLITLLGFAIFICCLVCVLVIIWARLFTDYEVFGLAVHGWATSMVVMTMFNGLILLCIGIVAEYIWRIHEEVKQRPGFIIRQEPVDAADDPTAEVNREDPESA